MYSLFFRHVYIYLSLRSRIFRRTLLIVTRRSIILAYAAKQTRANFPTSRDEPASLYFVPQHHLSNHSLSRKLNTFRDKQEPSMATESQTPITANGTSSPPPKPLELSIPLPNAPGSRIYIHLTLLATSLLLFLTSSSSDSASAGPASLGSFVYAMPDVMTPLSPSQRERNLY